MLKPSSQENANIDNPLNEVNILKEVDHKNVLKLNDSGTSDLVSKEGMCGCIIVYQNSLSCVLFLLEQ